MNKSITTKILAVALLFVLIFCQVSPAFAAYSTGTYKVNTSSGVNVRSGAGSSYTLVGAAVNGTKFTVSKISGSWGYTTSISCTNGTQKGWVCLDYCSLVSSSSSSSSGSTTTTTANSTDFSKAIQSIASNAKGKYRSELSGCGSYGEAWCGYYARYVLKNAYQQIGISKYQDYFPYSALPGVCNTADQYADGGWGTFYNFFTWSHSSYGTIKKTSNISSVTFKPGDLCIVDNNGILSNDGPDHVGIIIKVNSDGSFVTSEGNTGALLGSATNPNTGKEIPNGERRIVREYTYTYNSSKGTWVRNDASSVYMVSLCSVKIPTSYSISFSPSSLILDTGESNTITTGFDGDGIGYLSVSNGNSNVVSVSWATAIDWTTKTRQLKITAKKAGTATITVALLDSNKTSLFKQTFTVTVKSAATAAPSSYSTGEYTVNTEKGINLRSGANSSYTLLGGIAPGVAFTISKVNGDWGYTSNVKCTTGYKAGWVHLPYCAKTPDSDTSHYTAGTYKVITEKGINLRAGAGNSYVLIGGVSNGTTFTISKVCGNWGYTSSIKCTNGTMQGWVYLPYCESTHTSFSMSFSPSSLTLNADSSSVVTINFKGDGIFYLSASSSNSDVASTSWTAAIDWTNKIGKLNVVAKKAGTTKITVSFLDSGKKSIFEKTFTVTVKNTATPTPIITVTPTAKPTPTPTIKPTDTATPTPKPTTKPTVKPTATPTVKPTATVKPTVKPTATPAVKPTVNPSVVGKAQLNLSVSNPNPFVGETVTVTVAFNGAIPNMNVFELIIPIDSEAFEVVSNSMEGLLYTPNGTTSSAALRNKNTSPEMFYNWVNIDHCISPYSNEIVKFDIKVKQSGTLGVNLEKSFARDGSDNVVELYSYPVEISANESSIALNENSSWKINSEQGYLFMMKQTEAHLYSVFSNLANGSFIVTDDYGNIINDESDFVGTGFRIFALDADGNITSESLTIILMGDINGDGRVNSRDIASIQKALSTGSEMTDIAFAASDINSDSRLNSRDIASLQKLIVS